LVTAIRRCLGGWMMLVAGQTWRAAVLHRGEQSRSLLAVFPPPSSSAAGGEPPPSPASLRTLDVDRRNCAVVPSTGVTTLAAKVDPSGFPVDATVIHDNNGDYVKQTQCFVRVANGTKALDDDEKHKCLAQRWPGAA
jgi:hypothetical protein